MDLSLSEIDQIFIDTAHSFAQDQLRPNERSHEAARGPSAETTGAFTELGLSALAETTTDPDLPDLAVRCQVIRQLAEGDAGTTLALWSPAWLAPVCRDLGMSPDHAEQVGYLHLVTDLEEVGTRIPCVPMGVASVIASLDQRGRWKVTSVDLEPTRALGLSAANPCRCTLEGEIESGEASAEATRRARAWVRLWGATLLTGLTRAATAYTRQYLQQRVAFGRRLADHQGVAFLFADMAIRAEGAEVLVDRAAWDLEQGRPETTTDAWLEACEAALWVTDHAVQLLGGHGYMQDHPVEKWMRDARALSLLWGGIDAARVEAAREEA
ncbi:MAG: acyl-CoA dehydrogenase [Myxococcota bacterium]|nr:acyl-CoA dehydrogenase [Myxococcota bacterium]